MSWLQIQARLSALLCTEKSKCLGSIWGKNVCHVTEHLASNRMRSVLFIETTEVAVSVKLSRVPEN